LPVCATASAACRAVLPGFLLAISTLLLGAALPGFRPLGFLNLGHLALDCLDDGLRLLVAERLQDHRQELVLLVADVLLEGFPQLGHLGRELLALLRDLLQLGQELAGLLVVVDRLGREVLGFVVLPENGNRCCSSRPARSSSSSFNSRNRRSRVLTARSEVSTSLAKSSFALAGLVWISCLMVLIVPRKVWKRQSPTQHENGDRNSIGIYRRYVGILLNKTSAERSLSFDEPTSAGDGTAVPKLLRTSEMLRCTAT
jgi:hypothetical protein